MKNLTSLLRRILLHRRPLAAVAAMTCVFAVCSVVSDSTATTVDVYVAVERIPAGTTVTEPNLRRLSVPAELVPAGAITAASQVVAQMTVGAVPEGGILTQDSVISLTQATNGSVIMPMAVSPQILSVVRPGDHVSVFITGHTAGQVEVVRGIRVVTIPQAEGSGFLSGSPGDYLLVEVPEDIASQIAVSTTSGSVTVALE